MKGSIFLLSLCFHLTKKNTGDYSKTFGTNFKPVYGSDGETYSNFAMLKAYSCMDRTKVTKAHDGPCGKTFLYTIQCSHVLSEIRVYFVVIKNQKRPPSEKSTGFGLQDIRSLLSANIKTVFKKYKK